jgi:hypothetical protein
MKHRRKKKIDSEKTELLPQIDDTIRLKDVVNTADEIHYAEEEEEPDPDENRWRFRDHKEVLITAIIALAAVIIAAAALLYTRGVRKETGNARNTAYNAMLAELAEGKNTIEYAIGDDAVIDTADLINVKNADDYDVTIDPETIDASRVGTYEIDVVLNAKDPEESASRTFRFHVNVEDTKKPEITVESDQITLTAGEDFDPAANVLSVKDPVDGDLVWTNHEPDPAAKDPDGNGPEYETGWYLTDSNVDTSTPGDYTVTVQACDRNGSRTEQSYTVTVNAQASDSNATRYSDTQPVNPVVPVPAPTEEPVNPEVTPEPSEEPVVTPEPVEPVIPDNPQEPEVDPTPVEPVVPEVTPEPVEEG